MPTVLAILIMLLLLALCGVGPTLLLLPRSGSAGRILVIPIIGLASGILFTNFLAVFGLPGRIIAEVSLIFFLLLAVWAFRKAPVSRLELGRAAAPLLICAAGTSLAVWPLVQAGHAAYWGLANPDVPFYIGIVDHLDSHAFGIPGPDLYNGFYRGTHPSVILGLSYFFSMLHLTTGIPITLLFGVVSASMVFLAPASIYFLSEEGFGLGRKVALVTALVASSSSLVAFTFYLYSLGALTVVVILPVGLAFAIASLEKPCYRRLLSAAIVSAGFYYCYFPGFAVLAALIAALAAWGGLRRAVPVRGILLLPAVTCGIIAAVSFTQARSIFGRLLFETFSRRLTATLDNEILASFSLSLTEEYVPYFWGLKTPTLPPPSFLGDRFTGFLVLFGIGCLLFGALLLSARKRIAGLPSFYGATLVPVFAVIAIYTATNNSYGVFKLAAWVYPVVVVGVVACIFGIADILARREYRLLYAAPFLLLVLQVGFNVTQTLRLGRYTLGWRGGGGIHNAARLTMREFSQLSQIASVSGREGIIMTIPDPVVQRWAVPFLKHARLQLFPLVNLNVEDSSPRLANENLQGRYLLHWGDASLDLGARALNGAVWRNKAFAVTPLDECRNVLFLGLGWYREEQVFDSTLHWQQGFRWLRKRGEALLLNPSESPQQLRLTLISGYGNSEPERRINLLLNGRKFDEIRVSGYARVLSRPFVASRPWSQLEFEVQEKADPLPRERGLWNRWVPRDPRRLNVAVAEIALLDARHSYDDLESALDCTSADQFNRALTNGIYPDRWIGRETNVQLKVPSGAGAVEVRGMLPGTQSVSYPYPIQVYLEGYYVGTGNIAKAGSFRIRIPVSKTLRKSLTAGQTVTLTLKPASTFVGASLGINRDTRALALLLERVALDSASTS